MIQRLLLGTALSTALLFSTASVSTRAAEGEGHSKEHSGTHAGSDETIHKNPTTAPSSGPSSVIHGEPHKGVNRVPPTVVPHEGDVSIFGGKEHRPDGWRYRYENGAWWYWQPNNHWTYYDNGGWQEYAVESVVTEAPVASDPNYYWYHDQWWYLSGNRWSYFDHGHWHDGESGAGPKRRENGHGPVEIKGEHHGEVKVEHGGEVKVEHGEVKVEHSHGEGHEGPKK